MTDQETDRVTDKELELLKLLMVDPGYSYNDLSAKLGISRKTISARIKVLREKDIIERVGTSKKGYWIIKL